MMTREDVRVHVATTRQRLRLIVYSRESLLALMIGLFAASVQAVFLGFSFSLLYSLFGAAIGTLAVRYRLGLFSTVDNRFVHEHLNRSIPQLEESSRIIESEDLSTIQHMQLSRVLAILQPEHFVAPKFVLPANTQRTIAALAIATALTLLIMPLMDSTPFGEPKILALPSSNTTSSAKGEEFGKVRITVQPPAYTKLPATHFSKLDISAIQGSTITWKLELDSPADSVTIRLTHGGELHCNKQSSTNYSATTIVNSNDLYSIQAKRPGSESSQTALSRVTVIVDKAPLIQLLSPPSRTVFEPHEVPKLAFRVRLGDDFGITQAKLLVTLTEGGGENIQFRNKAILFDNLRQPTPGSQEVAKVINLDHLGAGAGTEAYFYIEATDNRQPEPNISRSEVVFAHIVNQDEIILAATNTVGIDLVPEYFRSQRQLIIDTQALIEQRSNISESEFKRRSNNLAIDQKLLRLRYGRFIGEEDDSGIASGTVHQDETNAHDHADDHSDEHDHASEHADEQESGESTPPTAAVLEDFFHFHDTMEEATYLAQSVKQLLRISLSAMWDAELHLRLAQPDSALPHEYRALRYLKDVQQRQRAYVLKVGFETAPLKPKEKRLRGDLSDVRSPRWETVHEPADSLAAVHEGLRVLEHIHKTGMPQSNASMEILHEMRRALVEILLKSPGLPAQSLQHLQQIIAILEGDEAVQPELTNLALDEIWKLVPVPEQQPVPLPTTAPDLENRYREQLRQVVSEQKK